MTTSTSLSKMAEEKVPEMESGVGENSDYIPGNILLDPRSADPVFQYLAETWSIRELARYNRIFRAWRPMVLDKLISTTRTQDWYFPIHSKVTCSKEEGRHVHQRTWSGIHHPSLELHTLPHIPETILDAEMVAGMNLPSGGNCVEFVATNYSEPTLLAISGGLMLFGPGAGGARYYMNEGWIEDCTFTVHNPLTNKSRELPKIQGQQFNDDLPMYWNLLDMVEDEKTRSYKVILLFMDRVFVYKSTSNSWSVRKFEERTLVFLSSAKALVNGKLYFGQLEINGKAINEYESMQALAYVAVFEVDADGGTWKQSMQIPIRDYFSATFDGFRDGSVDIVLVECMGRLFALIPTLLDLEKIVEKEIMLADRIVEKASLKTYNDYGYLPLQFYMVPLGDGGGVRQVRIRPLEPSPNSFDMADISPLEACRRMAMKGLEMLEMWKEEEWVRCHSYGNEMWLSYKDYLVKYDMVSGGSQTSTILGLYLDYPRHQDPSYLSGSSKSNLSQMFYSPSFNIKP